MDIIREIALKTFRKYMEEIPSISINGTMYPEKGQCVITGKQTENKENISIITYTYGYFTNKKGLECSVLIEFDEGNPCYGIYYGIQVSLGSEQPSVIDANWKDVRNSLVVKFGEIWNNINVAERKLQYCDHVGVNNKFWPVWIRLEESESVFEAIKGVFVIIHVLKCMGFEELSKSSEKASVFASCSQKEKSATSKSL